jgi:GntR family transcriptional regulator/MocR family aminotransferase
MLSVLKNQRGLAIWLQFNTVISLVQLSEQALRYDLLPKTILYQDKDTCLSVWPFE